MLHFLTLLAQSVANHTLSTSYTKYKFYIKNEFGRGERSTDKWKGRNERVV